MWRYAKIKGKIIKNLADRFWVKIDDFEFNCSARGNLKKAKICVGDDVEVEDLGNDKFVISKILPRSNFLIRPPISNIDNLFIVISKIPEPDFNIIDKMILFAFSNNITPYIVINKVDLDCSSLIDYVNFAYNNVCQILCVSARTGYNIIGLMSKMNDKINAFTGQSAVGKSSIINKLIDCDQMCVGDLSSKILRGKNTTRHCELVELKKDTYVVDTPGFSLIDEVYLSFKFDELSCFYPDYVELANMCKFKNSCNHVHEKDCDCAVKMAVSSGLLDDKRYARYVQIYENLVKRWKNEHK